jgi:antirestriction protein ArdC
MAFRKGQNGGGLSPAARITQEIIARLETGTKPWIKPWRGVPVSRPLRACGIPYRGMNVFWLWMVADMCGFASPFWMTYNQAKSLGAQVRKGEKSTIAIFYKSYIKEVEAADTGEKSDEARRVLKAYPVFNADQVDGLPERYHPAATLELVEPEGREQALDAFFGALPAVLRHQGDQAYYEPAADRITMPPVQLFAGFDHYYATLAHELSHWTGHASRLGRDLKNRFGTAAYAAEELVAELSSAMLGAELGLPVAHLDNHASYIEHWLKLLKDDDRAILTAAAKAEEASRLLLRLGGRIVADDSNDTDDAAPDAALAA